MTDEWIETAEFAHNPALGSPGRELPYTFDLNARGIAVQGIIPETDWHSRFKVQGTNIEKAVKALRAKLRWIKKTFIEGINLTKEDERAAQDSKRRTSENLRKNIPLSTILALGDRALLAQEKYKRDVIEMGIKAAERETTTLGQAVARRVANLPPPAKEPQRKGNNQAQTVRALLDALALDLGKDALLHDVIREFDPLREWIVTNILTPGSGWSFNYRKKGRTIVRRFLSVAGARYGFHPALDELFDGKIQGIVSDITALPPGIIRNVLFRILEKYPKRLLFALLQAFCGLRPEEAYQILPIARACIKGRSYLLVPATISKTGVQRLIRLRPAFLAWLNHVPGWKTGKQSFVDANSDGVLMDGAAYQVYLNDQIRIWWKGRIPTESFRKSWTSACASLGVPKREFLILESGHEDIKTLNEHYDAIWEPHMGLELFSIFPVPLDDMPSNFDLFHALEQKETDYEKNETIQ